MMLYLIIVMDHIKYRMRFSMAVSGPSTAIERTGPD
ncbi:protein of unknown function [Bradyrhizobium vignae]|uniref:Uncharacterized protein n=1 Tax=Bradyrhizobium vignae TaxID=1549949 RepID=A0A2U3QBM4_9BRAD|nr:protein of unknown function [Bradyrhizobium vignae]